MLIQNDGLQNVTQDKGHLRTFLKHAFRNHALKTHRDASRQKRGGGVTPLSLDWQSADTRYHIDPADHLSPDKLYDRAWAVTLLERVIARLREESLADGKARLFEELKPFLTVGKGATPYGQTAAVLGQSEGAVRVAVHRLRRRYRELLREEIGQTLSDGAQVEEELGALFAAFAEG
jgi:RNA polymerase sigma-70 factor (ECF subfamily)